MLIVLILIEVTVLVAVIIIVVVVIVIVILIIKIIIVVVLVSVVVAVTVAVAALIILSRDAIAFMVITWIAGFCEGVKFWLYCSDVAGAFDRVDKDRLLAKLRAKGLHEKFVRILGSWLQARQARVVVGGAAGDMLELVNMIYQGTVWGPWLWNVFFEDACLAIRDALFSEIVYADDLNAFRAFSLQTANSEIYSETARCQKKLHAWGRANRVAFDPGKESQHVISHHAPDGPNFKILAVLCDCRLTMAAAIHELVGECRWKLRALRRVGRFHSVLDPVDLYKSQVLSSIEYRTAGIYHACDTLLAPLDAIQSSYLSDLGLDSKDALFGFNLAPLTTRRDIAMLGIIHRAVLGRGPPQFRKFIFPEAFPERHVQTRLSTRSHARRVHEYLDGCQLEIAKRSMLGLTSVYNMLPEQVVAADSVSLMQQRVQEVVRRSSGADGWEAVLSPRHPWYCHPLR